MYILYICIYTYCVYVYVYIYVYITQGLKARKGIRCNIPLIIDNVGGWWLSKTKFHTLQHTYVHTISGAIKVYFPHIVKWLPSYDGSERRYGGNAKKKFRRL
jgi:hypothetical protein